MDLNRAADASREGRSRLFHWPLLLIFAYWIADSTGKYLWGADFPAGPAVYSSMRALLRYVSIDGAARIGVMLVAARLLGWDAREDWGFETDALGRQVLVGVGLGLVSFVLLTTVGSLLSQILPSSGDDPFASLLGDRRNILSWLFVVVVFGGLIEEMERVFVLRNFETAWGQGGLALGLLLSSIFFGCGHLNQGLDGAISTALLGAGYGYVYIRRRKIVEIIVAHAVCDIAGIVVASFVFSKGT